MKALPNVILTCVSWGLPWGLILQLSSINLSLAERQKIFTNIKTLNIYLKKSNEVKKYAVIIVPKVYSGYE